MLVACPLWATVVNGYESILFIRIYMNLRDCVVFVLEMYINFLANAINSVGISLAEGYL